MNQTILEAAESHFRPISTIEKTRRLAEIRSALKVRERALKRVEKQARLEKRAASKSDNGVWKGNGQADH